MTDKPTPTPTELKAMWQLHAADIGGIFDFARAVLEKWGQPAQAAEPFCWHWENTFNGGTGTVKKNPETLGINMVHPDHKWTALYTAPQPTTAQAASSAVLKAIREANMQLVRTGDDAFMLVPYKAAKAQAAEPVAWAFKYDDGTWHTPSTTEHSSGMRPLFAAPQPVAREPLPKFLALKFHARRDKKAAVTLLFPGHEAADAWVRGIKGGQHGTE